MLPPLLFISAASALDPRLASQGLPLLRALSRRGQCVVLLTFEPPSAPALQPQLAALQRDFTALGLHWHPYHTRPSPGLPARGADLLQALFLARRLIRQYSVRLIHVRSYLPALLALLLRPLAGPPFVFDMRGLLPDEHLSAGHWTRTSPRYRLAKRLEALALRRAAAVVVTSELFRRRVLELDTARAIPPEVLARKLHTIHNNVDTQRFVPTPAPGPGLRAALGLNGRRLVVLSAGHLMPWHAPAEVIRFFAALQRADPAFALLLLTQSIPEAQAACRAEGLAPADYRVIAVAPEQMPAYLSLAEAGLSFLKPGHEMANPIKLAEYLACGLPVVLSPGQGGAADLIERAEAGLVIPAFDPAAYDQAAARLLRLLRQPGLAARCRLLAEERYSLTAAVEAYTHIYEQALNS